MVSAGRRFRRRGPSELTHGAEETKLRQVEPGNDAEGHAGDVASSPPSQSCHVVGG